MFILSISTVFIQNFPNQKIQEQQNKLFFLKITTHNTNKIDLTSIANN